MFSFSPAGWGWKLGRCLLAIALMYSLKHPARDCVEIRLVMQRNRHSHARCADTSSIVTSQRSGWSDAGRSLHFVIRVRLTDEASPRSKWKKQGNWCSTSLNLFDFNIPFWATMKVVHNGFQNWDSCRIIDKKGKFWAWNAQKPARRASSLSLSLNSRFCQLMKVAQRQHRHAAVLDTFNQSLDHITAGKNHIRK